MKKIALILLGILISVNVLGQKDNDTVISNNPQNLKLKVMYFHITNRCHTCRSIEKLVRETIDSNFTEQLKNGVIDLYILNCELPQNTTLAQKYDAYGATFAITAYSFGKEGKTEDLSNWAFQKVYSPEIFKRELTEKINEKIK
jgi:hypothetical protein